MITKEKGGKYDEEIGPEKKFDKDITYDEYLEKKDTVQ